jgi:hypothetical protein
VAEHKTMRGRKSSQHDEGGGITSQGSPVSCLHHGAPRELEVPAGEWKMLCRCVFNSGEMVPQLSLGSEGPTSEAIRRNWTEEPIVRFLFLVKGHW